MIEISFPLSVFSYQTVGLVLVMTDLVLSFLSYDQLLLQTLVMVVTDV